LQVEAAQHSIYFGGNTSNIKGTGDFVNNQDGKGFRLGWLRQDDLSKYFSWQTGVLFTSRSYTYSYIPSSGGADNIPNIELTTDFVEVPLFVNFQADSSINLYAGLLLGLHANDSCKNDREFCNELPISSHVVSMEGGFNIRLFENVEASLSYNKTLGYLHKSASGRLTSPSSFQVGLSFIL
jgi:hypothetical protein